VTIAAINGQKLRNTMRTKTLIIASALVAAGIVTSAAQVFSVNVVGYVNVTLPTGFSMIAPPLLTANNTLNDLIPNPADGTTVYKWDPSIGDFVISTYVGFLNTWQPNITMDPGQGAFIDAKEETTLTFVGEVLQGDDLVVNLAAGFSMVGSLVPAEENLVDAAVNFPLADGDTVYFFRNGDYEITSYASFLGAFNPTPAIPRVGEGFWVFKNEAASWTRSFSVNQ
jgi:hypothetical protein